MQVFNNLCSFDLKCSRWRSINLLYLSKTAAELDIYKLLSRCNYLASLFVLVELYLQIKYEKEIHEQLEIISKFKYASSEVKHEKW